MLHRFKIGKKFETILSCAPLIDHKPVKSSKMIWGPKNNANVWNFELTIIKPFPLPLTQVCRFLTLTVNLLAHETEVDKDLSPLVTTTLKLTLTYDLLIKRKNKLLVVALDENES